MIALLTGCKEISEDDEVIERVRVGDPLPAFSVEMVSEDGVTTFRSDSLTGGSTVIVLFNTACPDCQRDLPLLNDYYLRHRSEEGFRMVAIGREEKNEHVEAFWKEHAMCLPYSVQTDRHVFNLFASATIPRIYFCSPELVVTRIDVEHFLGE